jgi:hypothetical protein
MLNRAMAAVLALAVVCAQMGCYVRKVQQVPVAEVPQPEKEKIVGITTVNGESVSFDPPGGSIKDKTLRASVNKTLYEIPLDQVQRYWVKRKELSKGRTIGLVAAVAVVGVIAGVAATQSGSSSTPKSSCPFIYSWNGGEYVLDAESYGGAITRGLERDDYSELEHLSPDSGFYRVMVTNEADETEFTNLMELQVVDHPARTQVVPDESGTYHIVTAPQRPILARDSSGRNLLRWLQAPDRLIWEPEATVDAKGTVRDEITMTFPKPKDASIATLVTNAATGTWGAFMMRESLAIHGRDLDAWYQSIDDNQKDREALLWWSLREELYELKVYVKEPTGWQLRGIMPGGGPVVAQNGVVLLDVSHVPGDELQVQIRPPKGFWALNYFAVDYSRESAPRVEKLQPVNAEDESGRNVLPELSRVDDSYYTMPKQGNRAYVTFPAPPLRPGMSRTVFLHSRGYYRLHLTPQGEPNTAVLLEMGQVADTAARLAAMRYSQWKNERDRPGN